jgi:hypothetical protein
MNGSRLLSQMSLLAVALLPCLASAPAELLAQQDVASGRAALDQRYPYVEELLNALDRSEKLIYEAVLEAKVEAPDEADQRVYQRLVRDGLASGQGVSLMETDGAGPEAVPEEVRAVLDRTDDFYWSLLRLVADPAVEHPDREAGALVRAYSEGVALSSLPTDMSMVAASARYGEFQRAYPRLHGLIWARRWLQLAVFEPLLLFRTPEARQAGIAAVVARFWAMLDEAPLHFPTAMPMAPTIAPNLVAFSPAGAAILENASMLRESIGDALVSEGMANRSGVLHEVFSGFQDRGYRRVNAMEWRQMAFMHGVGNQGGWAIGIVPPPDLEEMHMDHSHMMGIMPGM